jgi:hypothetical protein
MKKIGVVSFKYEAKEFDKNIHATKTYINERWAQIPNKFHKKFNDRRLKALKEIEKYAAKNKVTHLVFPGDTLLINNYNYENALFEDYLLSIAKLFKKYSLILETSYRDKKSPQHSPPVDTGIVCFEKGCEVGERIQQLFATSNGHKFFYKRLWAETKWGHRIKKLDGLNFLIWVCGEINFMRCKEANNFKVAPKFEFEKNMMKILKNMEFNVFFNPVHTPMGRTHLIKNKLKFFSSSDRIAIQTTNTPSFRSITKRAMYCFKNNREISYENENKLLENRNWLMGIIKI